MVGLLLRVPGLQNRRRRNQSHKSGFDFVLAPLIDYLVLFSVRTMGVIGFSGRDSRNRQNQYRRPDLMTFWFWLRSRQNQSQKYGVDEFFTLVP